MAYNKQQFKDLIERVLKEIGLYSDAAVNLLLGTAAQESGFGTHLRQLGGGPGVGCFQMEPATFEWLQGKYNSKYLYLADKQCADMEHDLKLAIIMCRLRYWVAPRSLPGPEDLLGLADMWKSTYNTFKGKGTVEEFMANYRKYVA